MITPRKSTARIDLERYAGDAHRTRRDVVAVEEPMEIRLSVPGGGEHAVAVTMRTPGNDFELAAGFLFSEGLVRDRRDVVDLRYCMDVDPQEYNVVTVHLREGAPFDPADLTRNFYTTSSCGVCGKASLEAVEIRGCAPLPDGELRLDPATIRALPDRLREGQAVFDRTGGLHAAGLFSDTGEAGTLREDVGRHNAVDKVIGEAFLSGDLPLADSAMAVSGRASFEILQKALSAGIPAVVAVGAPSSLAVDLARQFNITLIGFTRAEGFNVYTGLDRVAEGDAPGASAVS
ncbi:MAG: formate dehydrogenase accessory sulfurtransferase FdhD [Gemmatimonadota bacterium]|nr:formate dehydrogenase accessory sulfurtransferase FdhD [Gemmatimonadota bacterium]